MHRIFRILSAESRRDEVLVVIWGVHSLDWMTALAPSAPLWKSIPRVGAVVHRSCRNPHVSWGARFGRRTVMIPLMEEHMAQCPAGHAALVPTAEALDILRDKGRFAAYMRERGLSHLCPETYPSIKEAKFPCILKRTNLNAGHGVELAATPGEARRILENEPFAGHPHVVQAVVPFLVEYVLHCVCREGSILWHTVYAFDFPEQQIRKVGGQYTIRRATISEPMLKEVEAILLPLKYSGPCNVNYTLDAGGRLVVFEINPRFGGSLMRPENTEHLAAALATIIAQV